LILVEFLITTFYADIDGIADHHFLCWYWWSCWSPLNIESSDQEFHQYQQKVVINNSTNINKRKWWSTIPSISA
jgi:predicted DNA-binding protein (MmcQ/YjbR family)